MSLFRSKSKVSKVKKFRPGFEALERREVPTANLYLDFGFGFALAPAAAGFFSASAIAQDRPSVCLTVGIT